MMTIIYRLILLVLTLLVGKYLYEEEKPLNSIMASMVMVPMILRILMIK